MIIKQMNEKSKKKGFFSNLKQNLKTKVEDYRESKISSAQDRIALMKEQYQKALVKGESGLAMLLYAQNLGHPFHFKNVSWKQWQLYQCDRQVMEEVYLLLELITIGIVRIYEQQCSVKEVEHQMETLYYVNPESFVVLRFQLEKVNEEIRKRVLLKLRVSESLRRDLTEIFRKFKSLMESRESILLQEKPDLLKLRESYEGYLQEEQQKMRNRKVIQFGTYVVSFLTGLLLKQHVMKMSLRSRRVLFVGLTILSLMPFIVR